MRGGQKNSDAAAGAQTGTARKKGGQTGYLLTANRHGGKAMRLLRSALAKEVWAEDS